MVLRAGRVVLDGPPGEVFAAGNRAALAETGLEPPAAAELADRLGVGPVATETELVAAVARAGAG